jgi:hypothetical protein
MRRLFPIVLLLVFATHSLAQDKSKSAQLPQEPSPIAGIKDPIWGSILKGQSPPKMDCDDSMALLSQMIVVFSGRTLSPALESETMRCANFQRKNGWKDANGTKWQLAIMVLQQIQIQREASAKAAAVEAEKNNTDNRIRALEISNAKILDELDKTKAALRKYEKVAATN